MSAQRFSRRRRGGAAVELAVLSLVLIPLIMYTMFLSELFVMKLNGQEAAVQAPWDFTLTDFSNPDKKVAHDEIARRSRWTYCDHSAAYNSYQIKYDCKDDHHHTTMTAHECWLTKPGQQVKCSRLNDPLTGSGEAMTELSGTFPSGGVVSCSSRLGVMNYYLPNKFLSNFTQVDMTKKKRMKSRWAGTGDSQGTEDAHRDARENSGPVQPSSGGGGGGGGSGGTSQSLNFFSMGMTEVRLMTDTWAVTHMYNGDKGINEIDQKDIKGRNNDAEVPKPHPVYDRMAKMYWKVNSDGLQQSWDFHSSMNTFLSFASQEDQAHDPHPSNQARGNGDHMSSPSMRFEKNKNDQRAPSTMSPRPWAAGWGDSRNNGQRGSDYWQAMDPNGKQ